MGYPSGSWPKRKSRNECHRHVDLRGEREHTRPSNSPVSCTEQTWFLVHVGDRTEIATNDLKIGIVPNIVLRHFKHTKMKVGDWAE